MHFFGPLTFSFGLSGSINVGVRWLPSGAISGDLSWSTSAPVASLTNSVKFISGGGLRIGDIKDSGIGPASERKQKLILKTLWPFSWNHAVVTELIVLQHLSVAWCNRAKYSTWVCTFYNNTSTNNGSNGQKVPILTCQCQTSISQCTDQAPFLPSLPERSVRVVPLGQLSVCLSGQVTQKLLLRFTWFFLHNKYYTRGSVLL